MSLGFYGYMEAQSKVSLFSGVGFGSLLVLSSIAMFYKAKWGGYAALSMTLLLTVIFAYRYSVTGRGIPAIMVVLSGGMLLFLLAQTTKWKK